MKRRTTGLVTLILLLVGLAAALWYEQRPPAPPAGLLGGSGAPSPAPPTTTTAPPTLRTFTHAVPWTGTVASKSTVEVAALADGRIQKLEVQEPVRVEAGRSLAQIGGAQVDAERARLGAEVRALQSEEELARQTSARLHESLQAHLATRDQVAAAQDAQIALATRLRDARLARDVFDEKLRVLAPVAGVFTHRRVSVGQQVKAGQVIGDIIDVDHLRIVASMFPPAGIRLDGKEALVRLDESRTVKGEVRSVMPEASALGATQVWIEGPQIDKELRPGQTVGGRLVVAVRSDVLAVPTSAVVYDSGERPFVFVREGGEYTSCSVRLGLEQDGWVEVVDGVRRDDAVVTRGAYELFSRQFGRHFKVSD